MWTSICTFICDKIFQRPATPGEKRRNEDSTDDPPAKQRKLDNREEIECEDSCESSSSMKEEEKTDDEECSTTADVSPKKWRSSCTMARQSIHSSKYKLGSTVTLDKRKLESDRSNWLLKEPLYQSRNGGETEVGKYASKSSGQSSGKLPKNKHSYNNNNKIFNSFRTSNTRQNMDKLRPTTFQSNIKKSLNFLQESYRLTEKVQYMQLLQNQTSKLHAFFAPFKFNRAAPPKEPEEPKSDHVPVIDLTWDKNNIVINKSRENIPRTSSQSKSSDDSTNANTGPDGKEIPKVNSLRDILKTHPVTDDGVVDEILSQHSAEKAEKLRQAAIEQAKLKALSENNRNVYRYSLEEKIRRYMRITAPALEDIEVDEEEEEEEITYVLPELTDEQESKISAAFVPTPAGEVVVEKFGLQIKRRDVLTLKGLNWLNDEVINFYMNLIMERGKQENMPKVFAFNTFFYPKLLSGGHASLKRWTKKVDIFSHDMLLVPIHLGMHWCMAVLDFRVKEVRYYDSMGTPNNRCLQALLSYLEAESLDKKKERYNTNDWELINVDDIPQQMNGSDCGVFSCVFAEHLARDSPLLFTQENMPYFRKKMALEIVDAKLLT